MILMEKYIYASVIYLLSHNLDTEKLLVEIKKKKFKMDMLVYEMSLVHFY